jgi:outer membrane protein
MFQKRRHSRFFYLGFLLRVIAAGSVSLAASCAYLRVWAQNLPDQPSPNTVSTQPPDLGRFHWLTGPFRVPPQPSSSQSDPRSIESLLRDGKLYLTLDDAIDLAIANNFDVEVERYDEKFAETDLMRTRGGGLPRGVVTGYSELPAGVGGPGEPLLTTVGGYSPIISLPSSAANLAQITATQSETSILGGNAFSSGSPIPQFDPTLGGQVAYGQQVVPQSSNFLTGSNIFELHSLAGNFAYQQGFSPGTQFTATYNSNWTSENSIKDNIDPYTQGFLNVTLTQPLLQGFGIGLNRRFIHIAKNDHTISKRVFEQQLIATVSDLIRLYWDLVSQQNDLQVKQDSLTEAQRLYQDTQQAVEQGTQAPVQLTSAGAQVASSREDYINTQGLVLQQELLLKELLTRRGISDPNLAAARIEALTPIESPDKDNVQPIGELIDDAMKKRPDLAVAQLQIENSKLSLKGSRNQLLPQVNLVASMENNGLVGMLNPFAEAGTLPPNPNLLGGYDHLLDQIFGRDYPNYSVGLQLNIPLRNRVARADYERDELQYNQVQVRMDQLSSQVRLQVGNALIALQQAKSSYDAAVEARKLQEQALDVEQARFDEHVDTPLQLLQSKRDLSQAKSSEITALGVYAKAKAALERAVGLTLENHNVTVDQAYQGSVSATTGNYLSH